MKKNKKHSKPTKESIKLWQSICSHKGALLTNTGTSGSKCSRCGKEITPPNPNMNV